MIEADAMNSAVDKQGDLQETPTPIVQRTRTDDTYASLQEGDKKVDSSNNLDVDNTMYAGSFSPNKKVNPLESLSQVSEPEVHKPAQTFMQKVVQQC